MFNFENLSEKRSGGFVQTAATVLAVAISALASFQFFATYSGALLAGLVPAEFLSVAAGLLGVIMLEGSTLYWQHSVQNDADSQQQLTIARTGYTVSLIVSVVVTALYFLLTSSLVAPYVEEVAHLVNAFAAVVLVATISFQFVAKVQYGHAGARRYVQVRNKLSTSTYQLTYLFSLYNLYMSTASCKEATNKVRIVRNTIKVSTYPPITPSCVIWSYNK